MINIKSINFVLLLFTCFQLAGQNTIGGAAVKVPEAEVNRQSRFIDAERERLLGHFDKALEGYKQFLYENPDNGAAWYGLARTYTSLKDLVNALDAIAKAVTLEPDNEWYLTYQADLYEQTGQVKDAVRIYENLTKRFPQTTEFLERLAYLAVLAGDPQTGLKTLDRLEKLTGVTEETADKKHLIYVGMGEIKKAAAELQKLADTYPHELQYRHHLAEFYERNGDPNAARKVYEDILRHDPGDPVAKLAVLQKTGSDETYLQSLKPLFQDPGVSIDAKVKEILPYFSKLEGNAAPGLVQALLDLGQLVEKTHPDDAKAWSLSGDLFYYANRQEEALARYRTCIKLKPNVYSVWENALSILAEQKNYDELLQLAEKAMDDFPNQASAYYYYGMAAAEKGNPDYAIAQLEQATLIAGNNLALRLDIIDQIGLALLRKKDFNGAVARYEQVLGKGGDKHAGILEHLGDALFQAGERNKALEYWQKAQKIAPNPGLEQKISTGKL